MKNNAIKIILWDYGGVLTESPIKNFQKFEILIFFSDFRFFFVFLASPEFLVIPVPELLSRRRAHQNR